MRETALNQIAYPWAVRFRRTGYMAQQRNKGQAGMGGRGKNQAKYRQDVATRRKTRIPALAEPSIPGSPSGPPARRNQKRNQRTWRAQRQFALKKVTRRSS
jgi:hypothetical protein